MPPLKGAFTFHEKMAIFSWIIRKWNCMSADRAGKFLNDCVLVSIEYE